MEEISIMDHAGYAKLVIKPKHNNKGASLTARAAQFHNISPPVDAYNVIYMSFVLGGMGFLLPYNSFIMAMDYFKVRYPGTPVVFDMSLVYIVVALLTVLGNNLLVETFTLNSRINFGYVMAFVTLIFVVTCEVWWEAFGTATSYTVNLAAVAIVAVGCTVQQSSFYGYTSMLPPKYTQAVMVGESTSGVFTSVVRVITKCIVNELRGSTVYFFTVSVSTVMTCFLMYHIIRRSDFIQFYIALCERSKSKITLEPQEDAGLIESDPQYGILKIQTSPPPTATSAPLSFANPAYEPSATAPTYKVEDVVNTRVRRRSVSTSGVGISAFKRGLQARWEVTKCTWPYMLAIALVYFETLCVYPGVASEVISCNLGDWMPILMMALFNTFDLFGKMVTHYSRGWTGSLLLKGAIARMILIPVMISSIKRTPKYFGAGVGELQAFLTAILLGSSNGVLGSAPMIQAPFKVEDRLRELTGNMMTLMYMLGLTLGSLVAYSIESAIAPLTIDGHPCAPPMKIIPLIANATAASNVSSSTVLSVFSTVMGITVPTMKVFGDNGTSTETSLI